MLLRYFCLIINLKIVYKINKSLKLIIYLNLNYVLNKLNKKLILIYYYMLDKRLIFQIK